MQLYFYKVPKLEYKDEDIKLEFSLTTIRGNSNLIIAAAICERKDPNECIQGIDQELVLKKGSNYQKA